MAAKAAMEGASSTGTPMDATAMEGDGTEWDVGQQKAALEEQIEALEEKMSAAGDDEQLANIDLQGALQKQQQVLQTISNVSKMMHDTAMAIVRKIG